MMQHDLSLSGKLFRDYRPGESRVDVAKAQRNTRRYCLRFTAPEERIFQTQMPVSRIPIAASRKGILVIYRGPPASAELSSSDTNW
jgi:hypothetical protein